jgi:hypothetical protein
LRLAPHIAFSATAGAAVWAGTGDPYAIPVAVAAGVLPDGDHVLDYYVRYVKRRRRFMFLILHGWEYLGAMLLTYFLWIDEPWVLAMAAGYATQIGGDQIFNRVKWHTYLLSARIYFRFDMYRIRGVPMIEGYMALVDSLPYIGRKFVKPWFESRSR